MLSKALFSSKTDDWSTPQDTFDVLNKEFNFTLDPCADGTNHKCEKYYTVEDNGLLQPWGGRKSVLQSSIWKTDWKLGEESVYGRSQREHDCGSSHSSQNRHQILPRLHSSQSRSPVFIWKTSLWRWARNCSFSVNGCHLQRAKNVKGARKT